MAQAQAPKTGDKRGAGRPSRTSLPPSKKLKATIPTPSSHASPAPGTPVAESPAPEKRAPRLPAKILESRPLPSLREPQSLTLSEDEYQGIAASAVLATSLERSRQNWVHNGVFQKYWVKEEKVTKSGKSKQPPSKPVPPNNPDGKLQKPKGECRIRIEPHMLVAEVFVEEKNKPPPPSKQYAQNHGQQYRGPQQTYSQQNQQKQNRPLQTPAPHNTAVPPLQQQASRSQAVASPAPTQQPDKKADPVISMLANRASSDAELKALMKEVANGQATQEQLLVFQKHIDELTAIVQKQKREEESRTAREQQQVKPAHADARPQAHVAPPVQPQPLQQPRPPYSVQQQTPNYQNQQPTWTPPPPSKLPVILQFTTQGATEDRFLFPQNSILESLSPQHLLVSFMIVRKGREAVDTTGLELDKEYWQPITMMIEVAYGREEIMNCIRRWCKPAEEVRKYMEDTMKRCERAPESYLALRLPFKSTAIVESEDVSKEATPVAVAEKAKASKAVGKNAKKTAPPTTDSTTAKQTETVPAEPTNVTDASKETAPAVDAATAKNDASEKQAVQQESAETGRTRRSTRNK